MTNLEPLDFSPTHPTAPVPFLLNADEVSSHMLDISLSMVTPVRAYLADGSEENWFTVLDWVLKNSDGSPNRRYAMVETVGILIWSLTQSAGMTTETIPTLPEFANSSDLSDDEREGMQDAISLLSSDGNPLDGLDEEWLVYAAEDFPQERYLSAVGFWLFLLCGFLRETAVIAGMTPEALWDIMSADDNG